MRRISDGATRALPTLVGAAVLPALIFALVYARTIDLPFWDEWSFAPAIVAAHFGRIDWQSAWAQHNEHRIFFPVLLMAGLSRFGGWSALRETLFGVGLVTLNLAVLWRMLYRSLPGKLLPPVFLATSLLTFSLVQWENWFWGAGLEWFLAAGFAILSLHLVTHWGRNWLYLILALAAGTISGYSSIAGFACLPAGFLALLLCDRVQWRAVAFWFLGTAAGLFAYLRGFDPQPRFPASAQTIGSTLPGYALAYIGAPLGSWGGVGPSTWLGVFALLVVVVASIRCWRRKRAGRSIEPYIPWLGLCVFAIANALLTGYGRAGMGIEQALSSRYTTISTTLWIGVTVLIVLLRSDIKRGRVGIVSMPLLDVTAAAAFLLLATLTQIHGYQQIGPFTDRIARGLVMIHDIKKPSDADLELLYPVPAYVRAQLSELGAIHDAHLADVLNRNP
jgi:hypothetical protein